MSILPVAVAGLGVVFIWSALHGARVGATVTDLLAGRAPMDAEPTGPADSKDQGGVAANRARLLRGRVLTV